MRASFRFPVLALSLVAIASACASDTESSAAQDPAWKAALASQPTTALDGARFQVLLVEQGSSAAGDPDTLEFAGGRFHSTACDPYGFTSATVTTRRVGDAVEFEGHCTNPSGDRNDWHGTVRGDTIEGGLTWTPAKGAPKTSTYKGTRVR
jgi:hypothetical protein